MSHSILQDAGPAATLVAVDGRRYPLESARIVARAEGGIATSQLIQTYANPHAEALEVVYTLPLPADGAVLGYTIRIGERTIVAEVQPREQASKAYRDALYEGRTAGLLEQTRPDTFQQRLGNVPPGTRVEISIDVLHPLAFVSTTNGTAAPQPDPEWEYRFPTVVGVRYHGAPGRVPDASDLSPDRDADGGIPTRVELSLTIADANAGTARSSSHTIETAVADGGCVVSFGAGERLDRDVVVRWAATTGAVGARLVEGGGLPGDDGRYGLVTIVPPGGSQATLARDLTVLFDCSGSMGGSALELGKQIIAELLRSLHGGDRFALLAFANDVERLTKGLVPATERELKHALERLDALHAHGGTEMGKAITEALRPVRGEAQRQVVLVTDGQISFEAEVVGRVATSQNVRLHAVGVGSAPNRSLTQQAAAAGRGLEVMASDPRTASEAARRLVAGTASPVLTSVSVGGTAVTGEWPGPLRDVFAGQPLVVAVELSRQGGRVELRGDLAGSSQAWSDVIVLPASDAPSAVAHTPLPVGALFGRAVAGAFEIEMSHAEPSHSAMIEHRIETLGMRHRIATRRTSLVAIAEEPSVDPLAPRRRERLAVEVPAGVSAAGAGLSPDWGELGVPAFLRKSFEYQLAMPADAVKQLPIRGIGLRAEAGTTGDRPVTRKSKPMIELLRWLEPDLIVIEVMVPEDGFRLVPGTLRARWLEPDGGVCETALVVDPATSSALAPQRAGTIIRLGLRIEPRRAWLAAREVTLICAWTTHPTSDSSVRSFPEMKLRIPAAPESAESGDDE